jgi:hypothetical protein
LIDKKIFLPLTLLLEQKELAYLSFLFNAYLINLKYFTTVKQIPEKPEVVID